MLFSSNFTGQLQNCCCSNLSFSSLFFTCNFMFFHFQLQLVSFMGNNFTGKEIVVSTEVYATLGLDESSQGTTTSTSTSTTPLVISALSSVLERTIQKNEKLKPPKGLRSKLATTFHGSKAPTLSIRQYMERIHKYARCSRSCFVVAYIYMDRFVQSRNSNITSLNAHRLLITCVLLAAKFIDDACHTNAYYAKVGGVSTSEMNKLEMDLLYSLHFRLHVTLETFDHYCLRLEKEVSGNCGFEQRIQLCGKVGRWAVKKAKPPCTIMRFGGHRHIALADAMPFNVKK